MIRLIVAELQYCIGSHDIPGISNLQAAPTHAVSAIPTVSVYYLFEHVDNQGSRGQLSEHAGSFYLYPPAHGAFY